MCVKKNANLTIQSINKSIPCISLIGMPGAGKTTIGKRLAFKMRWTYIDSDSVIEAAYGRRLQDVVDVTDKASFLEIESRVISSLHVHRCVIGTGGSAIYSEEAMSHLASLGVIVYLEVPLEVVLERISLNPERGIAINPNQTMEDLFAERQALYKKWANLTCDNSSISSEECVGWIYDHLPESIQKYL